LVFYFGGFMSVDRHANVFHLTENGWQSGACGAYMSDKEEHAGAPENRLLSLKYEEHQTSAFSRPAYYIHVIYFNMRRYPDIVRAILAHGLYPDHGSGNKRTAENYGQDEELMQLITRCVLYRDNVKQINAKTGV